MGENLQERVKKGLNVTQKMISDTEIKLEEELEKEEWRRAAELASYLSGMRQIQMVSRKFLFTWMRLRQSYLPPSKARLARENIVNAKPAIGLNLFVQNANYPDNVVEGFYREIKRKPYVAKRKCETA